MQNGHDQPTTQQVVWSVTERFLSRPGATQMFTARTIAARCLRTGENAPHTLSKCARRWRSCCFHHAAAASLGSARIHAVSCAHLRWQRCSCCVTDSFSPARWANGLLNTVFQGRNAAVSTGGGARVDLQGAARSTRAPCLLWQRRTMAKLPTGMNQKANVSVRDHAGLFLPASLLACMPCV